MKKLIVFLVFLLIPITAKSQIYVSLYSETTESIKSQEIFLLTKVGIISNHIRVGVNYEYQFNTYYSRFSFELGRRLYIGTKIESTPTVNFGFIARDGDAFLSYGIGLENNYQLNKRFSLSLNLTLNSAQDLNFLNELYTGNKTTNYRGNAYIGVVFMLKDPEKY